MAAHGDTTHLQFTASEGTWVSLDVAPDSNTIVFDLLGNLYAIPVRGGVATPITSGIAFNAQPRYSPDGKSLIFVSDRSGSDNLWVANADGSSPRQVTSDTDGGFVSPNWTPDGNFILVSRSLSTAGTYDIWMYDLCGGAGLQITKSILAGSSERPRFSYLCPVMSSDSRFLYYARRAGSFSWNSNFPIHRTLRQKLLRAKFRVVKFQFTCQNPLAKSSGG